MQTKEELEDWYRNEDPWSHEICNYCGYDYATCNCDLVSLAACFCKEVGCDMPNCDCGCHKK
jgi:hypothetical protein